MSHQVRFVVIGGVAGILHGSALLTKDLDIVYERGPDNAKRLADALREIDATRRDMPKGVAAPVDRRAILNGSNFLLETRHGDLDALGETPSDRVTYEQLEPTARLAEIAPGLTVAVASLDDLIRMKRAAARPQDLRAVEHLSALRDERELREATTAYGRWRPARGARASRSRSRPTRARATRSRRAGK